MFTGIIEELGTVEAAGAARSRVRCSTVMQDLTEGASIAVNGVCLTAVGSAARIASAPTSRRKRCGAATWATCAPDRASTWSVRSRRPGG